MLDFSSLAESMKAAVPDQFSFTILELIALQNAVEYYANFIEDDDSYSKSYHEAVNAILDKIHSYKFH